MISMMKSCQDTRTLSYYLVKYLQAGLTAGLRIFGVDRCHIKYAERAAKKRISGIPDFYHQELAGSGNRRIPWRSQAQPEIAG
jgi:hypothetical protein